MAALHRQRVSYATQSAVVPFVSSRLSFHRGERHRVKIFLCSGLVSEKKPIASQSLSSSRVHGTRLTKAACGNHASVMPKHVQS